MQSARIGEKLPGAEPMMAVPPHFKYLAIAFAQVAASLLGTNDQFRDVAKVGNLERHPEQAFVQRYDPAPLSPSISDAPAYSRPAPPPQPDPLTPMTLPEVDREETQEIRRRGHVARELMDLLAAHEELAKRDYERSLAEERERQHQLVVQMQHTIARQPQLGHGR